MGNNDKLQELQQKLIKINKHCSVCGIFVTHTNLVLMPKDDFKCIMCHMMEKGFDIYYLGGMDFQYYSTIGRN